MNKKNVVIENNTARTESILIRLKAYILIANKLNEERKQKNETSEETPSDELINQIVEAGRYAPSGGNSQSTHFIVIESKEVLDKLANLAREEFAKMEVTEDTYKSLANSINASKNGKSQLVELER